MYVGIPIFVHVNTLYDIEFVIFATDVELSTSYHTWRWAADVNWLGVCVCDLLQPSPITPPSTPPLAAGIKSIVRRQPVDDWITQ